MKKFYMIMAGAAITAMAAFAATSLNGSVVGSDPGTPGNFLPVFAENSPTAEVNPDSYEVTVSVDFSAQGYAIYDKTNEEELINIPAVDDNKIKCQLQEEVGGVWTNIQEVKAIFAGHDTSWTFTATVGEHNYRVAATIGRTNYSNPVQVTVNPILVSLADVLALSRSENPTTDVLYLDVKDCVVTYSIGEIAFVQDDEAAIAVGVEDGISLKEGDTLNGYLTGTLVPETYNFLVDEKNSKFTATPGADVTFGEEIDLADLDANVNRLLTFTASEDLTIEENENGLLITQGTYSLQVFDIFEAEYDFTGNVVKVTGILYQFDVNSASDQGGPKATYILFPRSQADIVVDNPISLEEAIDLAPNTEAKVDLAGWQITYFDAERGIGFMQNQNCAIMFGVEDETIKLAENDLFIDNSIADITVLNENMIAISTLDGDPINYIPAMPKTITADEAAANVNRLVRFEAIAEEPIEDGEIAENILVADFLQVFDYDFEIPYYIESVSGILVDPMAMPMDDEDAEEGFYCLAPRSVQDIVAFEFKAPEALAININKDKPEQKLVISWDAAVNQAPYMVMGYKVEILNDADQVVVASDNMLGADVKSWTTAYLPNGDYTIRVTTFFTGNETAVSTKSYNMVGISALNAEDADLQIFDLQGRRVANPAEGLYIINGKKAIIRK